MKVMWCSTCILSLLRFCRMFVFGNTVKSCWVISIFRWIVVVLRTNILFISIFKFHNCGTRDYFSVYVYFQMPPLWYYGLTFCLFLFSDATVVVLWTNILFISIFRCHCCGNKFVFVSTFRCHRCGISD